ncbi:MAG: O-antigen ligase family protein [Actinomycetota bacterium]
MTASNLGANTGSAAAQGPTRAEETTATGAGRWPVLLLAALAALAPFNVAIPGTEIASLLYVRPLLAVVLVGAAVLALAGRQRPPRIVVGLLLAWVGAVWLSAMISPDAVLGASGAIRLTAFALVVLATARTVSDPRRERIVLVAMVGGTAVAAVVGLVVWAAGPEGVAGDPFFGAVTRLGPLPRLTRPWSHANVAAMALGASLPAAIVLRRWWAVGVGALVVVATVLTYSRGALAAMVAAAVVVIAVSRDRRLRVTTVGLATVGVLTALLAPGWTGRFSHPGSATWQAVEIAVPDEVEVGPDGGEATVEVANRSAITWPSTGADAVVLSARWVLDDEWVVAEHRWALPGDLAPDDEVTMRVAFDPTVAPGTYDLYWDLLRDGEAYFLQFSGREALSVGVAAPPQLALDGVAAPTRLVTPAREIGRTDLWRLALTAFGDEPVLGVGPAQLTTAVVADVPDGERLPGRHAHNLAIESLATTGLVGTVPLLLVLLGAIVRALRRAWRRPAPAATAAAAGLGAAAVHAVVDWPLIHTGPTVVIGVLVGLAWREDGDERAGAT